MTGDQFKAIRLRLGLTQKQLGLLLGVPQQRVSSAESRASGPTAWQAGSLKMFEQWHRGVMFPVAVQMATNSTRSKG